MIALGFEVERGERKLGGNRSGTARCRTWRVPPVVRRRLVGSLIVVLALIVGKLVAAVQVES